MINAVSVAGDMTCFVLSTDRSDDPGSDQSERCTQGDGHVSDRHQWKIIIDEDECRSRTRTKQFSWPRLIHAASYPKHILLYID